VDGEILVSGKGKLRIQKYPDTRGRGLTFESRVREVLVRD